MVKNKILFIVILLLTINIISASPFYYKVSMNYNKGIINIKDVSVIFSQEDTGQKSSDFSPVSSSPEQKSEGLDDLKENYGDYAINVIDINNQRIDSQNFIVPNIRMYDKGDESGNIIDGGEVVLDEVSFEIYAPYYENAKEIVVYDKDNKELTKADISMFSKTKANGLVNEISSDKSEIQTSLEKTTGTGKTTTKPSNNLFVDITRYWWILLIILVILIVILVYPRKKRR